MKEMKRILAMVLCLVMVVGMVPMTVFAADSVIDAAIFASDVHGRDTNTDASSVKNVFGKIAEDADLAKASSANFVGDTQMAQDTVTSVAQTALGNTGLVCNYAFGSHDDEGGATIADVTGILYENDNYYVYAISQTDMENANNASTAASAFATKVDGLDSTKPMFILSHMPMHAGRNDNKGAASWFNAIQTAAASMDIVFFWGHNHTEENKGNTTEEDRAAYYIAKDGSEELDVYNGTATVPGFTYMNAGYIGRTEEEVGRAGIATTVKLYADKMVFQDYNSSGAYSGDYAHNVTVNFEFANLSTDSGDSGSTVNTVSCDAGIYDTVTAIGTGLTKVTADVNESVDLTGFDESATAVYDVTLEGYTEGTEVTLVFDLYYLNSEGLKVYSVAEDGTLTEVAFTAEDKVDAEDAEIYYSSFTVTTTSATGTYLIGKEGVAADAVITGISVTKEPKITGYVLVKDDDGYDTMYLDLDGLEVTATYDNGQTDVLDWNQFDEDKDGYVLGDFDLYTPGTETITITYGEFTTSFDVVVYEKTVADVSSDETVAAAVASVLKEGYVAQDIDLTGYTQGDLVKVAMNVPANANVVYHVAEDGTLTKVPNAEFNNGVATFTTDHFSTYAAGEERVDVWEWIELPGDTTYELDTDGTVSGNYLIVGNDSSDDYAMTGSGSISRVTVDISNNVATVSDSDSNGYVWTIGTDGKISTTVGSTTYYLRATYSKRQYSLSVTSSSSSASTWELEMSSEGSYTVTTTANNNTVYLRYNSGSFSVSTSENTVQLYSEVVGVGGVAGIAGASEYTVDLNTTADAALAAVKAGITGYYGATSEAAEALNDSALTWTWVDTYDGATAGSYTVAISYNGTQLGTVEVKVVERQATSITADEMSGSVRINSGTSAPTGTKLAVIYEDNTTATVDVTVGMLTDADGNPVSTATQGTYKNLIINYGGQKITGYTLVVNPIGGDNYPEYPKQGAVRVNKVSDGAETNFQSTGVTKVELSTTGVPYEGTGADIILCLDWTNSMDEVISGSTTRKVATANATRAFLKTILLDDEGNLNTQTRILIYGFEGGNAWHVRLTGGTVNEFETITMENLEDYQTGSLTTAELLDDFLEDKIEVVYNSSTKKYTTDTIGGAESSSTTISVSKTVSNGREVSDGGTSGQSGGTTYGEPLAAVYEKFAATTYESGQEKSQFCVFMSDGAPTALDYYGIVTESQDATTGAWTYTYDIYGSTNVVSWLSGSDSAGYTTSIREELWSAKGRRELGVTYFSVGLGINESSGVSGYTSLSDTGYYTIASALLESIATDPSGNLTQTFFPVTDTAAGDGGLATAFEKIASSIKQAGTKAYFVDTMGDNFDLQMNTTLTNDLGSTTTIPSTDITVTQYTLIKRSQIGQTVSLNGVDTVITEEHVGIRTGESSVLETVSFKVANDGTVTAYSSVIGSTTNILVDGVIYAKNFFYNTTAADVKIDTDGDGTTDYTLPAETFYWNIGTISESEVALSYYVYLDGALDGEREAGDAYNTNKSATLYYTNYLGNSAYKDTVSPVVAWQSAVVSYAFYLVDADTGLPITNITTGATGSFNDSVKVTIPTVYKTVMLNSEESIHSILASDVLLEGYELYDPAAKYSIKLDTVDDNVSGWEIVKGTDRATTYVTSYGGEPTTDLTKSGSGADYTNTVVYFAVKFQIQTINDAVVVDYGLPVDITVMGNDFFGNNGKLVSVGSKIPDTVDNTQIGTGNFLKDEDAFKGAQSVDTTYGSAEVNVTSEDSYFDGYVRYTPDTMNFDGVDKVAYCVKYTDPDPEDTNYGDVSGYYYGEISVIPATTVYYEDNFTTSEGTSYITYSGYSRTKNEDGTYSAYTQNNDIWKTEKEENAPTDVTQAEDRPGQYSPTYIDANNVYGYDAAYDNMTTWSMGSAKKIHVDANQYGTAEFTFTGTGFDVISMTDSTTGTLVVQVYEGEVGDGEKPIKSLVVDTYYGYVYDDANDEWILYSEMTDEQKAAMMTNAIMQVPVMQISGLTYGQYTVKITALYYSATDQTSADGYDLYLDAIRIYDPIATDKTVSGSITVESVYKQDEEGWPIYQELRNNVIDAAAAGETNGIVFVDGVGETAVVSDYTNYGPNNELYLAPGQAIGFNLDLSAFETYDSDGNLTKNTVAAVQLGIKSADGNPVTYKIFDAATVASADDLSNVSAATVNTATDMYYDIYNLRHKTIVIVNTGNEGILSLTDIKLTFTEDPPAVTNLLYVTGETVNLTLKSLNDVPEDERFDPATFNVYCANSAYVGNRVNVSVETSSDVAAITVNDVEYTKYYQNKISGKRIWTTKLDVVDAENINIVVVAYDVNGTPSDPISHTIEVTDASTTTINVSAIKDVVNKILGWLKG